MGYGLRKVRDGVEGSRAPGGLVELLTRLVVDEGTGAMPDLDPVVNTEPGGKGGGHEEAAVGRPLEVGSAGDIEGADFAEGTPIKDVRFSGQVAVACEED